MKLNFRKIASVIASAVMIGSTAGTALAANYPTPFVVGGVADAAVVITSGSQTGALSDYDAALSVKDALTGLVTTTTTTGTGATATGGDSVKFEKSSDKLDMNDALSAVKSTKLGYSEMPNLLKTLTYRSKDNIDYSYEQGITIGTGLVYQHFSDNDYKEKTPTLGIVVNRSLRVLNYTLEFTKAVRSDVDSSGRLEDMQDRDITILGKTYKLLNAYNASSSTKFEFMRGAATDWVNMNEEKTVKVGDKSYTIKLNSISTESSTNYAQLTIVDSAGNSQTTTKLAKGGTYKLSDGSQIGITDITYQNFAGGVMSAEFTIGANKLTCEQAQLLEIDDTDQQDITCWIARTEVAANKVDINKITFEWKSDDKAFVTADRSLTMPGLQSVKLEAGNFTTPMKEVIKVSPKGSTGIELTVPIKDGDAKFTVLEGNTTNFRWIADDTDGTGILRTPAMENAGNISYDLDTDDYFIASWNSTTDSETYMLHFSSLTDDSSQHKNITTLKKVYWDASGNKQDIEVGKDKKTGDAITIGNVEITLDAMSYTDKTVVAKINAGGSFERLYTKGGLAMYLPYNVSGTYSNSTTGQKGVIFNETDGTLQGPATWKLQMVEEDKDGNLGKGVCLNISLGHTSEKAEVTAVTAVWSAGATKEIDDSDVYEGYVLSALATKVLHNQPSGSQDSAEVEYHGGESYGNVFLTAPEVTITSGGSTTAGGAIMIVKDTEVEAGTGKDKNLIVVGGSCINTVARKIVDPTATAPICGADFTAKTTVDAGKRLVQAVASPYNSAKIAVLVAGYEAAETKLAVSDLMAGAKTDVGSKTVNPVVATQ